MLDDGAGGAAVRVGHGLEGLRARVEELGGRLEAGPRADGSGFRLSAQIGATTQADPAPAPGAVTPPRLTQFAQADYPPEALAICGEDGHCAVDGVTP